MFDIVIINDDLERAYEELKDILDEVSETRKYFYILFNKHFAAVAWQMLHRLFYIHDAS